MRVGKKPNVVDAKKGRSCVVRLEKVANNSRSPVSPTYQESQQRITRNNRLSITAMGVTPKGRKAATPQQEEKTFKGPLKKKPGVGSSTSNLQTPQPKSTTAAAAATVSNIRSNQKVKVIPKSNKATPVSTPVRDETPTPTIAAGRSRRAIKPNPKYASEDLVTPKVVRNVAMGSSANRAAPSAQSRDGGKPRKLSTSSDDFYNRDSDDEFDKDNELDDDDRNADKAYQINEKDLQDSDFSDIEEIPSSRFRGRPKKSLESTGSSSTPQATKITKLSTQTLVANIKRTTQAITTTNIRTVPSQLQQIRRSLASANAQRNNSLLAGSGTAQKRKLEEESDDDESSYSITRKQMIMSTSTGNKVRVPVKDNKTIAAPSTNTPFTNKSRVFGIQKVNASSTPQQTLNGGNKINSQTSTTTSSVTSRKIIEIPAKSSAEVVAKTLRSLPNRQQQTPAVTTPSNMNNKTVTSTTAQRQQTPNTQTKLFATKSSAAANRLRSGSPKPTATTPKEPQSNTTTTVQSSATSSTQQNVTKKISTLSNVNKSGLGGDKQKPFTSSQTSINNTTPSNSTIIAAAQKKSPFGSKPKSTPSPAAVAGVSLLTKNNIAEKTIEIKEDSPNSTMDDFETMPTFTIVNVNDIINKKGDVLITKSKVSGNKPTVIEFSESISLDDDDDDDNNIDDDDVIALPPPPAPADTPSSKSLNMRKDFEIKKSPLTRSSEPLRMTTSATQPNSSAVSSSIIPAPQILNHKLGLRNSRVTPKTTTTLTLTPPDKPAPRILNSMVAKKTEPVKPMIANLDDSADESFPLSLDEYEEDETEDEVESKTFSKRRDTNYESKTLSKTMTDKIKKYNSSMEMDTDDEEVESKKFSKRLMAKKDNLFMLKKENVSKKIDSEEVESKTRSKTLMMTDKKKKYNSSMEMDTDEDIESQNTEEDDAIIQAALGPKHNTTATPLKPTLSAVQPQRKKRTAGTSNTPIVVSNNKKRMLPPVAAKENSLAATNQQVNDAKLPSTIATQPRKATEKVVISKQGDKIIKKITCFETWYVINMPLEPKRHNVIKNLLEMPLIKLANIAKRIELPTDLWSCKVTLYELSALTLAKSTFVTYTGDITEHNISEEDRGKYQPSCVMFRRSVDDRITSRMPYDRAVIFKNKTFYTNIEGKNVRLIGAPSIINSEKEIEILLEVVDSLTLQSDFVEHVSIVQ